MDQRLTVILVLMNYIVLLYSQAISCTTYNAAYGGTSNDYLTSIACPSSQPTMVSCMFKGKSGGRDGGFIEDGKCYARNGGNFGEGAAPYARCCSIAGDVTCKDKSATLTDPTDNTIANIYCDTGYVMTGCTLHGIYDSFDGIRMINSRCQLQSSVRTVTGYARCCKQNDNTVSSLSCTTRSSSSTAQSASLSCLSGETMTGCSALEAYNQLHRWYGSGNTCFFRRKENNGLLWYLYARCCTITTQSPTPAPTSNPTNSPSPGPTNIPTPAPTNMPSPAPTLAPTRAPTFSPTLRPTQQPTSNPTADPTIDPTSDPTKDPTADPTIDPTADPTSDPTADPTADPTIDPTRDPTSDPTTDPSSDPTIDPTADPTAAPT